jgi:hypothetical protein
MSKSIPSALQVAERRANRIAAAERAAVRSAEWAKRLDPAAYVATREGEGWRAEGPAGQSFLFLKGTCGDVIVRSHTGGRYEIVSENGARWCSCPVEGRCKHLVALDAVYTAATMAKQLRTPAPVAEPVETPEQRRERILREVAADYTG